MALNLIKLCVGADSIDDLREWVSERSLLAIAAGMEPHSSHITRMIPKRDQELLDGGSLYWVIKGVVLCRQRLVGLERIEGEDGIARCALMLDRAIIRTEAAPRRAFQGWRYLDLAEAPRDLPEARPQDDALPPDLARALAEIGLR